MNCPKCGSDRCSSTKSNEPKVTVLDFLEIVLGRDPNMVNAQTKNRGCTKNKCLRCGYTWKTL